MSEDKTYILKPGVTFGESNDKDYVHMYPYFTASMRADIHKSIFDQCFTEFSFDATRKQLRDALEPEICYWQDTSDDTTEYWGEELLDSVVEKALTVLGLLGGTTNE